MTEKVVNHPLNIMSTNMDVVSLTADPLIIIIIIMINITITISIRININIIVIRIVAQKRSCPRSVPPSHVPQRIHPALQIQV
jgi:hypothetical protein